VGVAVEQIDGGFAAIFYNQKTISRRLHISLDKGKIWKAIDEGLQPSLTISSIKQTGKYLLCGHPDGIFRSADLGKTWSIVHPRIPVKLPTTNFKIHLSGNVLYAVAKNSGC
jgi:hypothetical protein